MAKPNWGAMLTEWKALVHKPTSKDLQSIEKDGRYLSDDLEGVKEADAKFSSEDFKKYKDLCDHLNALIGRCDDLTQHTKKIQAHAEAVKFIKGVGQAAKDRKASARKAVSDALTNFEHMGDLALKRLIQAGDDRAAFAKAWYPIHDLIAVGEGEGFPKLNDTRRAILNMLGPDDKHSKVTLHDYKAAVYNFREATKHVF